MTCPNCGARLQRVNGNDFLCPHCGDVTTVHNDIERQVCTRFVPTCNGPLHVGHAYTLLVNEEYAHSRGGKFIVRFDDRSPTVMALNPEVRLDIMEAQRDDIRWLDVKVDEWQVESQMMTDDRMSHLNLSAMAERGLSKYRVPTFVGRQGTGWEAISYVPRQTYERVWLDWMSGVTHLIRGDEWVTELSLYSYFCERCVFEEPQFIFLPRLRSRLGDDISKTLGGHSLHHCRTELGITANELKGVLRIACLRIQTMPFSVDNLLPEPKLWM